MMVSSHSQSQAGRRRRWRCLLPLLVGAAFLAEIAFLGRLDMAKNAEVVESWTTSFYRRSSHWGESVGRGAVPRADGDGDGEDEEIRRCEQRLEREDAVPYDRDFDRDPVLVGGAAKDWSKCYVGCQFGFSASKTPDATFGIAPDPSVEGILRSMESSQYYSENNIDVARGPQPSLCLSTCQFPKPGIPKSRPQHFDNQCYWSVLLLPLVFVPFLSY
ncbi:3-alpha-L-fucosyltransferase [Zea mays]|uniref:3-alpha-L-fucosyltransferase n=1 Tax=Zea mays TaxID=4577 RepID=A0A1D6KLA2_MAIZE|nr:3-alpha-L-fucosyltransferase [Zea mays]